MSEKYVPPKITTIPANKIVEALGPCSAGSQPEPPCRKDSPHHWLRVLLLVLLTATLGTGALASSHTDRAPDRNVWFGLAPGATESDPGLWFTLGARVGWIGGEISYSQRDDMNSTEWLIQEGAQSSAHADTYYFCPDLYAGSRDEVVGGGLDLLAHFDPGIHPLRLYLGVGWYRITTETFEREQDWYVASSTPHHHIKGAEWGPWYRTAIDEEDRWAGQIGLHIDAMPRKAVKPTFRVGWHSVRGLSIAGGVQW